MTKRSNHIQLYNPPPPKKKYKGKEGAIVPL